MSLQNKGIHVKTGWGMTVNKHSPFAANLGRHRSNKEDNGRSPSDSPEPEPVYLLKLIL